MNEEQNSCENELSNESSSTILSSSDILSSTSDTLSSSDTLSTDSEEIIGDSVVNIGTPTNNKSSDTNDCVICLETGNVILNPLCDCRFYFHEQCYSQWLINNKKLCILCNKDLSDKIHVDIFQQENDGILVSQIQEQRNNEILNNISVNLNNRRGDYITNSVDNAEVYIISDENNLYPVQENIQNTNIIRVDLERSRTSKIVIGVLLIGSICGLFYGLTEFLTL